MLSLWVRSFFLGTVLVLLISVVAFIGTEVLSLPGDSDAVVLGRGLRATLLAWYGAAVILLFVYVKHMKSGIQAFVARIVLLWGPISLGWLIFSMTGESAWFSLGTYMSSIVLVYEILVHREREKATKIPEQK